MALRKKLTMEDIAKFWASVLIIVKQPAKTAHTQAVRAIVRRRPSKGTWTRYALNIGPAIPTTEETEKSRYV